MSKKSRLQKQKQKQTEMKRLADLEELEEIEAAKHRESKGARKMRKKARRGEQRALMVFFTILMLAAFLYSGFFYGGVTIVGTLRGLAELIAKKTAWIMFAGDILMFLGIILSFYKKYRVQAVFAISGCGAYLYSAQKIILDIQQRLDQNGVDPDLYDMDKEYMLHYYPIAAVALFSLVIFIIALVKAIRKSRREKRERDNAPVESIVE